MGNATVEQVSEQVLKPAKDGKEEKAPESSGNRRLFDLVCCTDILERMDDEKGFLQKCI